MFNKKIPDHLVHNVKLITTGFVNKYPDATLKGPIKIIGNKKFYLGQFRKWAFLIRHHEIS